MKRVEVLSVIVFGKTKLKNFYSINLIIDFILISLFLFSMYLLEDVDLTPRRYFSLSKQGVLSFENMYFLISVSLNLIILNQLLFMIGLVINYSLHDNFLPISKKQ